MKIIITDKMADEGIKYLIEKGFEADAKFGIPRKELLDIIANYDAIIVRSSTQVDKELIGRAVKLKAAGRAGNGIDNIDVEECTRKGIAVVNTPEGNTMAAAEMSVAMAFAMFRNIPQAYMAAKKNDFRRGKFTGAELNGKTAGIVGLGRIGSIVASRLKGCNMKILGFDPYVTAERMNQQGIGKCENLEDLLAQSDLITIHIPMTASSRNLIDAKELKACKKGIRIVNAARGGILNEKALYDAIKEGHVAGAAIDTLEHEPDFTLKPEDQTYTNPLLELDNVIITPHLGASTAEANLNVSIQVAKLIESVLRGEIVAAVNMPVLKTADFENIRPYIDLAEKIGKIYYQTEKETVTRIEVIYSGDLAEKDTRVITLSAMKGFMSNSVKETVNYINVEDVMKGAGVSVIESKSSQLEKYTNLITLKFKTKFKELAISGTVFGKEEMRIVDFYGYRMDFEPTDYVLAVQNVDQPGVIGNIGSILGSNNINISAMQWSRNKKGDKAMAFVGTDCEIDETVVEKIREINGVMAASCIKFKQ